MLWLVVKIGAHFEIDQRLVDVNRLELELLEGSKLLVIVTDFWALDVQPQQEVVDDVGAEQALLDDLPPGFVDALPAVPGNPQ